MDLCTSSTSNPVHLVGTARQLHVILSFSSASSTIGRRFEVVVVRRRLEILGCPVVLSKAGVCNFINLGLWYPSQASSVWMYGCFE